MQCIVNWNGGVASGSRSGMGFVAETGSGHTIVMDGPPDEAQPHNGGANLAPRPLEALLAGTGGCTVALDAQRADTDPKVFTRLHMHFTVTGRGIPASAVERAIALSHEKYCSASIMLGKTADITTSFELREA